MARKFLVYGNAITHAVILLLTIKKRSPRVHTLLRTVP